MHENFLAQHMAAHILAMNVAAPVVALLIVHLYSASHLASATSNCKTVPSAPAGSGAGGHTSPSFVVPRLIWMNSLAAATLLQLVLLWGWHSPAVFAAATASAALMALMHLSLFAGALWFWSAVVVATRRGDWAPLGALLVTGKLFCLLGLLLAFAPRPLYAAAGFIQSCFAANGTFGVPPPVADQQLAGLLMLTACPLVYVTAAIAIAGRLLRKIESEGWTLPARAAG